MIRSVGRQLPRPRSLGGSASSDVPTARTARQPSPTPSTTSGWAPGPSTSRSAQAGSIVPTAGPSPLPAEVKTGTRDYYRQRAADFQRRNPGVALPDYYLGYGDKYCQKFANLGPKDLSPAGLKWRDATLLNLQNAIEKKRAEDPVGFAQLERNPQAFKEFCYGTHPDAYIQGGLFKLPASDLLKIASTPEIKDLIGKEGLAQVADILSQMRVKDVENIGKATVGEVMRRAGQALEGLGKKFEDLWRRLPMPTIHFSPI